MNSNNATSKADSFGQELVRRVRDDQALMIRNLLDGKMQGKSTGAISTMVADSHLSKEVTDLIYDVCLFTVDSTMAAFLEFLSSQVTLNRLRFQYSNDGTPKEDIVDASPNFAAELVGSDGWLSRFASIPTRLNR